MVTCVVKISWLAGAGALPKHWKCYGNMGMAISSTLIQESTGSGCAPFFGVITQPSKLHEELKKGVNLYALINCFFTKRSGF